MSLLLQLVTVVSLSTSRNGTGTTIVPGLLLSSLPINDSLFILQLVLVLFTQDPHSQLHSNSFYVQEMPNAGETVSLFLGP